MLSGTICGSCCCRYLMFNSSSLLAFQFHIASAVSAGFVMTFWSKQEIFVISHHKFDDLGEVDILLNGVFGFLPKCASNGVNLVVALGVNLRILISSVTSDASLCGMFRLPIFITESLDFSVLISRYTIPMDR